MVRLTTAKPEQMPDWWPPDRPPQLLDDRYIYRDKDGYWRHADGRIASRKERRRAGIKMSPLKPGLGPGQRLEWTPDGWKVIPAGPRPTAEPDKAEDLTPEEP